MHTAPPKSLVAVDLVDAGSSAERRLVQDSCRLEDGNPMYHRAVPLDAVCAHDTVACAVEKICGVKDQDTFDFIRHPLWIFVSARTSRL